MDDYGEQISDSEKARIAHDFIIHSPPGEVETVMKDVRTLLNNDNTFVDGMMSALTKYRMDQFSPVSVDDGSVLITNHGKLDEGRFLDPKSQRSFKYNVSSKSASDVQQEQVDSSVEGWRSEIENSIKDYIKNYYPNGVCTVYGNSGDGGESVIIVCIEDHKFSPENFWNGRWRSEWHVTIDGGNAKVVGLLKTQVHYYEDGNVQLVSQKECKDNLTVSSEKQIADDVAKLLAKCEFDYQNAIIDNYRSMSTTTFKALRRQLPVTRTRIDWNKILGYQIGKEIGK
ncbi:F-actin-capping protein subunit alpha-2-like [Clavelina lepadiformis]|uniref:F-actin-capping protein subunit alpha-2-like n=1 Tax=Clavelina lepadiformis TaxID=159417 RepID=UPI0040434F0D